MMQVYQNKQVAMRSGGLNRAGPVRVSPAESNLVKPLKNEVQANSRVVHLNWWVQRETTETVDIPASPTKRANEPNRKVISKNDVN
jgi:hypothetical protein